MGHGALGAQAGASADPGLPSARSLSPPAGGIPPPRAPGPTWALHRRCHPSCSDSCPGSPAVWLGPSSGDPEQGFSGSGGSPELMGGSPAGLGGWQRVPTSACEASSLGSEAKAPRSSDPSRAPHTPDGPPCLMPPPSYCRPLSEVGTSSRAHGASLWCQILPPESKGAPRPRGGEACDQHPWGHRGAVTLASNPRHPPGAPSTSPSAPQGSLCTKVLHPHRKPWFTVGTPVTQTRARALVVQGCSLNMILMVK